jgi:uncharacterized protein involved in exopolysaccharide biosynthesis
MSTQAPGAPARRHRSRKWWPAVGVLVGVLAGAGIFNLTPRVYQASTTILIIPQRVPEHVVRSLVTTSLGERLNSISQQLLSRIWLELIIQRFEIYEHERKRLSMEDVIQGMRRDISIGIDRPRNGGPPTSFWISYRSTNPRNAMRITEHLASLFVQVNLEDRSLRAEQTTRFLQRQAEEARLRLVANQSAFEARGREGTARPQPQWLSAESSVLRDRYLSLLRKQEDAQMAVNLERRQIGEQFRIIDGARIPERPIGPKPLPFLVWGALGGLASSLLVVLLSSMWRRRTPPEPSS